MILLRKLALSTALFSQVLLAQSAPLTDAEVDALKRVEAKKRYEIATSDRSDGIAGWEISAYAWDLARKGAYPDMVPSAHRAVQFLETRLGTYRGADQARLSKELDSLKAFEAELARDINSASQNEVEGLFSMGKRYNSDMDGVTPNKKTALEYFSRAAAKGHVDANYNMAMFLRDDPAQKSRAISYMQEAYRLGHRNAAGWLRDWGAPLSTQHASAAAAQVRQANGAASSFIPGSFAPLFWGTTTIEPVSRVRLSREQLLPMLRQIKAGGVTMPAGAGYRAWGLPLGSTPSNLQIMASANNFDKCTTWPVTPRNVGGIELSSSYQLRFEEWKYGNRRAIYVQCATGNAFFEGGANNWMIYYLVDERLVAVRAVVNIYPGMSDTVGSTVYCVPPTYTPQKLAATVMKGDPAFKVVRLKALAQTPISGIRLGHWYTLSKPGVIMHIFPNNWPRLTVPGLSKNPQCGTGASEYLIAAQQFHQALQVSDAQFPVLRIGRPAQL
ncbi:MAG: tetratricopeptide repeat protein [Novosphingobium sp.]